MEGGEVGVTMAQRYARWMVRWKWAVVLLWMATVVAALVGLPQLQRVVAHTPTTYVSPSAESQVASRLANEVDPKHQAKSTVLVAIRRDGGLTSRDQKWFGDALQNLAHEAGHGAIVYVSDAASVPSDVAKSFVSADKTTEIGLVGLNQDIQSAQYRDTLQHVRTAVGTPPAGARVYLTGDMSVQADAIDLMRDAADKTALVTVALVLVILLAVFRAVLAPLLTLIAVGLSYLVSSGLVAWAAEHGLPISTFTQTFLIAVLFGAGTDYTVILLNRFREELTKTDDRAEALAGALAGVSKTVVFSALTVLVSFAALYFAKFGLYRSGAGVAVGIAIMLITCLTLIPALMALLGRSLYWPKPPALGQAHPPSRLWGWTSAVATRRPWPVLLALAVVLTPVALAFTSSRAFDPMSDIPNAPSVQGFHAVADAFGQGRAMPTTVIVQTDANLRTPDGLAAIDAISRQMAALPGVQQVDSATQPTGSVLEQFELRYQNQQVAKGLGQVGDGLGKLSSGFNQAAAQSQQASQGLGQLERGAEQLAQGVHSTAEGAGSVAQGTQQLAQSAGQLASGLAQVQQGASQLQAGSGQLAQGNRQVADAASALANALAAWAQAHPGTSADPSWQQIQVLAAQVAQGSAQTAAASQQLAAGAAQLAQSLGSVTHGSQALASGAQQLAGGAAQLASGSQALARGANHLSAGLDQFAGGILSLTSGMTEAKRATSALTDGVNQAQSALQHSAEAPSPGFYVPADAIQHNAQLRQALDAYVSPDGHIAKFQVILNQEPYSSAAIATVGKLKQAAQVALLASPIHTGHVVVGGPTAVQAEMNQLSSQDFARTMLIVFAAIFLLLVLMLRSVLTPALILLSLGATYFVTMGMVQQMTIHVLHDVGVNWAAPFFIFLLLVALGVDYSIFLMARFDEALRVHRTADAAQAASTGKWDRPADPALDGPAAEGGAAPHVGAIRHAMRAMGGVIFSAAVIMAGTFGSLVVTGMPTLLEMGVAVVIGLALYVFVLLAFFLPAAIRLVGAAHRWPFDVTASDNRRHLGPTLDIG